MQKEKLSQAKYDEQSILIDEYSAEFWQKIIFDAISLALKINQNPLISRQEALKIIPRSALDKGVGVGKLKKSGTAYKFISTDYSLTNIYLISNQCQIKI